MNQSQTKLMEVCNRLEQAAKQSKSDRVFNIMCSVAAKLERQGQPFAPRMSQAELDIVEMYLND